MHAGIREKRPSPPRGPTCANNRPCAIYYYSKYERTIYRKLQQKYPDVCSAEDIEELFDPAHAIDLYYDVVKKATEWPTWDFSIKTLAKYLGFSWRDTHPSGAASIEWFDRWIKTGDRPFASASSTTTKTTVARRACCWMESAICRNRKVRGWWANPEKSGTGS